jgi:hypothetical protein
VVWMWEGGGKRRPLMMARYRLQTDLPHHTKYDELRIYFLIQKGISRPLARCIPTAPTHPYPLSPPTYSIKTPKKKILDPARFERASLAAHPRTELSKLWKDSERQCNTVLREDSVSVRTRRAPSWVVRLLCASVLPLDYGPLRELMERLGRRWVIYSSGKEGK